MAINKINVDGVEHELAGSGGGGSDLVCVIDVTEMCITELTDYSCFLDVTWFHDNITWDNIHNMKIVFKAEIINDIFYTVVFWNISGTKNEDTIMLYLTTPEGLAIKITMTSDFTIINAEETNNT